MKATKQNTSTTIRTAANIYWDKVETSQGPIYVTQVGGLKICIKVWSACSGYTVKIMSRGRVLREFTRELWKDLELTDADILTIAGQHAFTAMCELLAPHLSAAPPCVYTADKVCVGA